MFKKLNPVYGNFDSLIVNYNDLINNYNSLPPNLNEMFFLGQEIINKLDDKTLENIKSNSYSFEILENTGIFVQMTKNIGE